MTTTIKKNFKQDDPEDRLDGTMNLSHGIISLMAFLIPTLVSADTPATLNPANTAWVLTATGLVLFMTLPGLALFYGGLVRTKNVLSVLMQ